MVKTVAIEKKSWDVGVGCGRGRGKGMLKRKGNGKWWEIEREKYWFEDWMVGWRAKSKKEDVEGWPASGKKKRGKGREEKGSGPGEDEYGLLRTGSLNKASRPAPAQGPGQPGGGKKEGAKSCAYYSVCTVLRTGQWVPDKKTAEASFGFLGQAGMQGPQ